MTSMMRVALLSMALLAGTSFAQGAEEYCAGARADGEECYRSCCEMLGYPWEQGGCAVPDAQVDQVDSECGYCTDQYVECMYEYENGAPPYSPGYYPDSGNGGCCSGFIILSALGIAAFRRLS
jgi:hypothetical protein